MISTPNQAKTFIGKFMGPAKIASLSATLGTVSVWNTRLPKAKREQLISKLLENGAHVVAIRNITTGQLEGEYFGTFYADNQEISGEEGFQQLMQGFNGSKMDLDIQFSE